MEILFFNFLLFNRLSTIPEKCLPGIVFNFLKYNTDIFRTFFNVPDIILGTWIQMKILPLSLSLPLRGNNLIRREEEGLT